MLAAMTPVRRGRVWVFPDGLVLPVISGGSDDGGAGDGGDGNGSGGDTGKSGVGGDGNDDEESKLDESKLDDAAKVVLAKERQAAKGAERARKAAESKAAAAEAELEKVRKAHQTDDEKKLDDAKAEAKAEVIAELHQERIEGALIRAASGKLADPQDAVVFLAGTIEVGKDGRPDPKAVETAIADLLKARPYLAPSKDRKTVTGDGDGGARGGGTHKPTGLAGAVKSHYSK